MEHVKNSFVIARAHSNRVSVPCLGSPSSRLARSLGRGTSAAVLPTFVGHSILEASYECVAEFEARKNSPAPFTANRGRLNPIWPITFSRARVAKVDPEGASGGKNLQTFEIARAKQYHRHKLPANRRRQQLRRCPDLLFSFVSCVQTFCRIRRLIGFRIGRLRLVKFICLVPPFPRCEAKGKFASIDGPPLSGLGPGEAAGRV
jgi:hypothetical protein